MDRARDRVLTPQVKRKKRKKSIELRPLDAICSCCDLGAECRIRCAAMAIKTQRVSASRLEFTRLCSDPMSLHTENESLDLQFYSAHIEN